MIASACRNDRLGLPFQGEAHLAFHHGVELARVGVHHGADLRARGALVVLGVVVLVVHDDFHPGRLALVASLQIGKLDVRFVRAVLPRLRFRDPPLPRTRRARALLRLHGHRAGTQTGRDRQCGVKALHGCSCSKAGVVVALTVGCLPDTAGLKACTTWAGAPSSKRLPGLVRRRPFRHDLGRIPGEPQDMKPPTGAVRAEDQAAVVNLHVVRDASALARRRWRSSCRTRRPLSFRRSSRSGRCSDSPAGRNSRPREWQTGRECPRCARPR